MQSVIVPKFICDACSNYQKLVLKDWRLPIEGTCAFCGRNGPVMNLNFDFEVSVSKPEPRERRK